MKTINLTQNEARLVAELLERFAATEGEFKTSVPRSAEHFAAIIRERMKGGSE